MNRPTLLNNVESRGDSPLEFAETAHEGGSPEDRAERLGALIRSWMDEESAGEQRETIEHLVRALDESRLSDRKLFPEELKGKSW